ncbi:uncharacterized protein C8Q71DRAFT_219439 [Rhodofomes roseus]|uniref:JmjC domain-containing protein n=1 Tax=Rhodofomes roseus TaxID=34475 RepID=A0ABQ8KUR1_9APHY|nr:uncharacterized protein C8Q71DRAFT_219439 [Rhodofomes roseus]KAH9842763.1 hypothetical protein C8Q71DRAFT_219439 [Rhodofomes roseus]
MESHRRRLMEKDAERTGGDIQAPPVRDRPRAQSEAAVPRSTPLPRRDQSRRAEPVPTTPLLDAHPSNIGSAGNPSTQTAVLPSPDSIPPPALPHPPISSKGWSISGLQRQNSNFQDVPRVSWKDDSWITKAEEYERQGMPLIVEDWHTHPKWCAGFDADRLVINDGDSVLSARNVQDYKDIDMTLADFIDHSRTATRSASKDPPLYAKDVDCPQAWREWLFSGVLPKGIQPGGTEDLLGHLPVLVGNILLRPSVSTHLLQGRVETIMCYYGIGDTFTPCHKDLCGSTGHNLMCHTENGSSFWFMTSSDVAPEAATYFQEELGKELDWENHATTLDELGNAPFTIYIAEQKLGDLIIIPPRSCHQVVNQGGLTMKLSWSRMTAKGLTTALLYELPIYRRVCRPEIYRTKSVLHHSLRHYTEELAGYSRLEARRMTKEATVLDSLVSLFDGVVREEYGEPTDDKSDDHEATMRDISGRNAKSQRRLSSSSSLRARGKDDKDESCTFACDFCGADIFQSYFKCDQCCMPPAAGMQHEGDSLVICPSCYVEGRSCRCTNMTPTQRCKTQSLLDDRNKAVHVLQQLGLGEDSRITVLTQKDLKNGDDVCVFQAACALRTRRAQSLSKLDERRTCHFSHISHQLPYLSTIYCHGCHHSWCLTHLLESGIHASEAFLALPKELGKADNGQWHQVHGRAKLNFGNIKPALTSVEKTGTFAPEAAKLGARLVLAALRFRNCRAVNSMFTVPGFYDHDVSIRESDVAAPVDDPQVNTRQDSAMTVSRSQMPISAALRVRSPGPGAQDSPEMLFAHAESPMPDDVVMSDEQAVQASGANVRPDAPMGMPTGAPSERPRTTNLKIPYVLIPPGPSELAKRKRAPAEVTQLPPKRRRTEVVRPRGKSPNPDYVDDDYGGALVNVMQSAYNQPQQEVPSRRRRAIRRVQSPVSEPDDPIPRGRHGNPLVSRPRPSQIKPSPTTDIQRHREMVASSSKVSKSKPRRQGYPGPSIAASSQPRTSVAVDLAAQSSDADTTNKPVLIRAPRGKPPGRPASCDVPPATSHAPRPKFARNTPREPGQVGSTGADAVSDLQRQLQQSETRRLKAEAEKGLVENNLAMVTEDLKAIQTVYKRSREDQLEQRGVASHYKLLHEHSERELRDAKDALRAKDQQSAEQTKQSAEQTKQIADQTKQIADQTKQIADQTKQLHDYQEGLQYLANQLETHLRSGVDFQRHVAVPQDLRLGPIVVNNIRQLADQVVNVLITESNASELRPQSQVPGPLSIGMPTPGPSATQFMIAPPPQPTSFGHKGPWTGGRLEDSSQMHMNGGQGRGFPNGWRGNGHRLYPNQSRGQPNRRGRGGYAPNASPDRPYTRSSYGAPGNDHREWVPNVASRRRSWAPDRDHERGQPVSSQRLSLEERLQPADGPRDRSTSPPVPSSSRQKSSEPPRRELSTSSSRAPSRSVRDQSREPSPMRDRDSPSWSRTPDSPRSVSQSHGYWEDTYERDENDDGDDIKRSSPLSSLSSSSGLRDVRSPDPGYSDTDRRTPSPERSSS